MTTVARLFAGLVLVLTTAASALVLTAAPAAACSCVEPTIETFNEIDHDVTFSGVVAKRREVGDEVILTMRVDRVFEGEITTRVDVVGDIDGASCGLEARDGDRLVVFGTLERGEVNSGLCKTVTGPGKYYRQLMSDLGEGTAPAAGYMPAERRTMGLTYEQFLAGRAVLGVLGLLGLGYFAFRALRSWLARRRTSS